MENSTKIDLKQEAKNWLVAPLTANCTAIIAEVAQAHEGSLGMAHAFIDAAATAGVDAVKFQTHIATAESTALEPWRVKFSQQDETRFDYWKRMEFTAEQWAGLKTHADEKGLVFLSSPFSGEAVELPRTLSGIGEFDRVLGGGFVPGTALLVGGDPGIGKSTLLLQACAVLGALRKVLYVTGEESVEQIAMRAQRLGLVNAPVELLAEVQLEAIVAAIGGASPEDQDVLWQQVGFLDRHLARDWRARMQPREGAR